MYLFLLALLAALCIVVCVVVTRDVALETSHQAMQRPSVPKLLFLLLAKRLRQMVFGARHKRLLKQTTESLRFEQTPRTVFHHFSIDQSIISEYYAALGVVASADQLGTVPRFLLQGDRQQTAYCALMRAAYLFPSIIELMLHPSIPFSLLGAVHFSNTVEQFDSINVDQLLSATVVLSDTLQQHRRGSLFVIVLSVFDHASQLLLRSAMTMLAFHPQPALAEQSDKPAEADSASGAAWQAQTVDFSMPADAGRRFAGFCGDFNPIHVSSWTARMFGFRAAIAHGMALQAIGTGRLQLSRRIGKHSVEFVRPVFLPAKAIAFQLDSDGQLSVTVGGKQVHQGRVE